MRQEVTIMSSNDDNSVKRRDFLRGAGLAAGAAAGAAVLTVVEAPAVAEAASPAASGYRETDHVRRVYQTARF
jgi:DMSO/TMAO reductase YedYZ molybdopterin-dependent catalytic subunit